MKETTMNKPPEISQYSWDFARRELSHNFTTPIKGMENQVIALAKRYDGVTEERVSAVAEILKAWGMERGNQTAARLALEAAARIEDA